MQRFSIVLFLLVFLALPDLAAQCPMCRATAETNLANGGTEGQGLNNGIMYMLGMPYLVIGTIAFFWWRNRNKLADANTAGPQIMPGDQSLN